MARVLAIASCDDNEVDSLERVQIGDELIERLPEMNVGAWQLRSGKGEHDALVLGDPELTSYLVAIVGGAKSRPRGYAGNEYAVFGNLAWTQRFGHVFVCDAEQIGMEVGP